MKNKKMRLAFIKKKFSIYGGAERYLQTFIQHLQKAYEIHVFANQWIADEGILFHKVNIVPFGSFLSVITFNTNVKKAIKKIQPDCVISFERTTCQHIYRAGEGCHAEWLKIRTEIEPFYKCLVFKTNPLHLALLYLEKKLFSDTKLIIANSNMVKDQIIKHYGIHTSKITVIYNGVDLIRFSPEGKDRWRKDIRKDLNIQENLKVLLFVGSDFKRKGLKTFLHSVSLLKRNDIKALIIGKGGIKNFRLLAETFGISKKIIFLEPQKDIEKFYAAADLFVLPTLYDPFSNATLEAMASGLPVITTKNNGVGELIDNGQQGFILNSLFDPRELADKIALSLRSSMIMGEKARKKAEKFPIEGAVQAFTEIFDNLTF
jgi:UDP-glucose:(heptosyl)LPS alpha-1,3-glucosyltransferase